MAHLFRGILNSNENKQATSMCNNTDETQKPNVEWKRPDTKYAWIKMYDFIYK